MLIEFHIKTSLTLRISISLFMFLILPTKIYIITLSKWNKTIMSSKVVGCASYASARSDLKTTRNLHNLLQVYDNVVLVWLICTRTCVAWVWKNKQVTQVGYTVKRLADLMLKNWICISSFEKLIKINFGSRHRNTINLQQIIKREIYVQLYLKGNAKTTFIQYFKI